MVYLSYKTSEGDGSMTTTTSVNVKALAKEISDKATATWQGKRFDDISDVHRSIMDIADATFLKHNIEGLHSSSWSIKHFDMWEDVLTYELDYKKDNRHKWSLVGVMNSVTLKPALEISDDTTIEELTRMIEKNVTLRQIANVEKYTAEAKETYEQGVKDLVELQEKLKSFE